jgi:Leucine-rich repeat (LRR) protein
LTSLPELPSTLQALQCQFNQLTSLTELPLLKVLNCSNNQLTILPELPLSLESIDCAVNHLTSLPVLPDVMCHLDCCRNQLTSLPPLPSRLKHLDCVSNHIRFLPQLPERLTIFYCKENPLEILPELPLDLIYLMCDTPYGEQLELNEATLEEIQSINTKMRSWTEMLERESKMRCNKRCTQYKEQIMMKVWHPSRVERLLEMGYEIEDM